MQPEWTTLNAEKKNPTLPETKRGKMQKKIETLVENWVSIPIIRKGEGDKTVEGEAMRFGVGGNERGIHETVHELELSGSGKPYASWETQGKRVPWDGTGQAINGLRSWNVQIPKPSSIHYPSEFLHHSPMDWINQSINWLFFFFFFFTHSSTNFFHSLCQTQPPNTTTLIMLSILSSLNQNNGKWEFLLKLTTKEERF